MDKAEKKQLKKIACNVRKGVIEGTFNAKSGHPGGSLSIADILKRGWDVGIGWQDGRPFHGPCHIRLNLALPHTLVEEACGRMKQYVFCD